MAPKCPHCNLWNLWMYCLTCQKGLCRCNQSKTLRWEIILDDPGEPSVITGVLINERKITGQPKSKKEIGQCIRTGVPVYKDRGPYQWKEKHGTAKIKEGDRTEMRVETSVRPLLEGDHELRKAGNLLKLEKASYGSALESPGGTHQSCQHLDFLPIRLIFRLLTSRS